MATGAPVRYAVVGLGWIAQQSILPAFRNARRTAHLAALVSGDDAKLAALARRHDVPITCSYDDYERLLTSGDVDAVFIALPNHMHRDYTLAAARHGVHVLCEKPMAASGDDCRAMIRACREHDVRLMIAYRLHFEEANLRAVERVRSGELGEPRLFASLNMQNVVAGDIRLQRDKGGGTLPDIGIYCINAARYIFGAEPVAGWATGASRADDRFEEVEEMTSAVLRFPDDRLATFSCSFGSAAVSNFRVVGTDADLLVEKAYSFRGERCHHLTRRDGGSDSTTFEDRDQFGPQILYFSDCIREGRDPEPDGEEGLIDTLIIEALHASMQSGAWVELENLPRRSRRPDISQELRCPPVHEDDLVEVSDPTK